MKISLTCVIVGVPKSVFDVDIDDGEKVTKVKDAIRPKIIFSGPAYELQLFLAKAGDGKWLESDSEDVKKLKKGEKTVAVEALTSEEKELQGEYGLQKVLRGMPTPSTDQIHVLVVVPKREPPPTQIFPTFRPYSEGINVRFPHLSRDALVEKLHEAVLVTNFVLLSSPSGSGKTSLLTLFCNRYPALPCVAISLNEAGPASRILSQHGIDVSKRTCQLPYDDEIIVVMLDDSQRHYHDLSFWTSLIKGALSWIPPSVRFVISATHSLETEWPESPIDFQSFRRRIVRDDLLLDDDEVRELFDLGNGLPLTLRSPALEEVVIRECAGHIGALRIVIDTIVEFFEKTSQQQQEVLAFCFSDTMVQVMGRLYGRKHAIPSSIELQTFLIKCLLNDSMPPPMQRGERDCFIRLMKAGIITQDANSFVKFTSPLATRYYSKYLFPMRGDCNPSSLNELIRKVIANMSARVLSQSTVDENDFPQEATFQHQFMEGLALWTHPACSICPELSKVFPALPHQRSQRIGGEIDFEAGQLSCSAC